MQTLFQPFPMLPKRSAQVWCHHPSFRRPAHFHEEPELNVVTRGRAKLALGRATVDLEAGDVVFFNPGQDHELLEESPDLELFVLALDPHLAARCRVHTARRSAVLSLDFKTTANLRNTWLGLGQVWDATTVEQTLGDQFVDIMGRMEAAPALCRRAVDTVRIAPEITEHHIAELLGVHPSEVSHTVRTHLGMRFVDYRAHLRLMSFVGYVDNGRTLTRAAFASGFGSYAQLHRQFRKHFTCSPAEYFNGRRDEVTALLASDITPTATPSHCASGHE